MGEDEAFALFRAMRWHATGGDPVRPACGCAACYEYRTRRLFKCKACGKQFSVTSGTIFHGRKLPMREYLVAIAIFVNGVKGKSALELGRGLDVSYKTAYVLAHKLREAMGADQDKELPRVASRSTAPTSAATSSRPTTRRTGATAGKAENQSGKRRVVVVTRERGGRDLSLRGQGRDRGGRLDTQPADRQGQHRLRRRGVVLGRAARQVGVIAEFARNCPLRPARLRPCSGRAPRDG